MSDDNLRCPFCGSPYVRDPSPKANVVTTSRLPNNNPPRFQVRCRSCGARGPKKGSEPSAEGAWSVAEPS